jgi:diguanylate cyclase (GGDEF)-like protein
MGDPAGIGVHAAGSTAIFLMRSLILAMMMVSASVSAAWGAQPRTLNTLHAIHTLTKAEARGALLVAFEATVTYYNRTDVDLFVQDGSEAIYVETKRNEDLVAGDRVLVRGRTRDSFTTDVLSNGVTVLHHGALPTPIDANFDQLIRAQRDCVWVTVRAKVRSADIVNFGNMHGIFLKLMMEGGSIDATVIGTDASRLKELLDSEVDVTGVVSGKFDSKMQLIGILLEVPAIADVRILKRTEIKPDLLSITPMNRVLSSYYVHDLTSRVRVQGTITYYQPGSSVVLQNGNRSLWISTHSSSPMRIGDVAVATGFPDARDGFLALSDGEVQDSNIFEPIQPQPATWGQLATWNSGDPDGHQNDLVSFEGKVAAEVRAGSQDEFVLASDGKLFTAIYRHPPANRPLAAARQIPLGTRIRVTGICMAVEPNTIGPTKQEVPFNILLRSLDDISIVTRPSWLNVRNLMLLVGLLLLLLFAAILRGWVMERKVRRQDATAASIERRRSRILEDINGPRPLAEIMEEITQLVSFKLGGAPCWCKILDGAQLGDSPTSLHSFRVVQQRIPSHSGATLGMISAAFDALSKPRTREEETLSLAAALGALAIETRRLYSDLVHRSEYDLLTDIHNRFSLEKYVDQQIEHARQNAGIFGLIYIDLNDFKQVNDIYGHHVGDLYLQYVVIRMKHQLREIDMLARLGGDEFAVLLPKVRNRTEVEEIALRLQHSLDTPFAAEGHLVHGSASVGIGLYPEDGTTRDSVLGAADAVMYVNKQIRRKTITGLADHRQSGFSSEDRG